MSFPFRRILNPVDFEDSSMAALDVAIRIAQQNDGTILLLHVVPMAIPVTGMPIYVDIYKSQGETAKEKLREIAGKHFQGLKYETLIEIADPAKAILKMAKQAAADVIVMATHGRRGFSRVLLGSVAEVVLREAPCPVLCVRRGDPDKNLVARWMSSSPMTATPDDKLAAVQTRMHEANIRFIPVVDAGRLVGIVTDRDVRSHMNDSGHTEVKLAMNQDLTTVTPATPLHEAARILFERKLDGMPVLEEGQLIGVITTSDILRAFLEG